MSDDTDDFGGIDDATWERLAEAARAVRPRAYVPYSDFPVGAALLTPAGEIFAGCNVENATIGATSCAERTAIGCAIAAGHREFVALAVITAVDPPSAPCGICRQVLAEFCDDLPILLLNPAGGHRFTTLDELLPMRFSGRDFVDEKS
jgi:cytidine deaminase